MWFGTERLQLVRPGDDEEVQGMWLEVPHTVTVPPRSEAVGMAELAAGAHYIGQLGLVELSSSHGTQGQMSKIIKSEMKYCQFTSY